MAKSYNARRRDDLAPGATPAGRVECTGLPLPVRPVRFRCHSPFPAQLLPRTTMEHVNLVFVGHVDSGKSTLCGQLLVQSGAVDEREVEKLRAKAKENNRESWWLAYLLDTDDDERARGKTVHVGRAAFEGATRRYVILDAPGHRSYVPNMIAGACQADVAVLMISARKGEFEAGFERGGQTREHMLLCRALGVQHVVVAVNKMDDPTVGWSAERLAECRDGARALLRRYGFRDRELHFVPLSALAGHDASSKSQSLHSRHFTQKFVFLCVT
ncbi:hypothetical protein AB1Y20_009539 [Prymnesium parvum]|uniref:Tr-type G domain-containing protein n=1 Tax=Prymnesium parvum TaxID=97485 RepID=A0AB34K0L7_PRYPA